ncbi:MAG: pilus assembly protein [Pseudomonadota bacterium]
MIRLPRNPLRRFRKDEDGGALVIEFVVFVPLLFSMFLMAVEMGVYTMRHMFLDRGLDITVRFVRLNTGEEMSHEFLKGMICDNAGFLDDCDSTLRLEMTPIDPRNFATFNQEPDCIDISEEVQPERGFTLGETHEIMMLRACVKFLPVFPTTGLGFEFEKDGSGRARMISSAVFVQEPS